jgi:hypothetical protein
MLSDDTEFTSSGVGNNTDTNYLENYESYKELLIKGLGEGKSHFLNLFATWNREVFPRSQVSENPDSLNRSAASSGGGNMEALAVNSVADILKQLSFEENEDEDQSEGLYRNAYLSDRNDDFYASDEDPPRAQSTIQTPPWAAPVRPVPSSESQTPITPIVIVNAIAERTNAGTDPSGSPTLGPNTHLVNAVQHHQQSGPSKTSAPTKTTPTQATRRASSRTTKTKVAADVEITPVAAPIQPIGTAVPPKPKRATRGAAKGKTRA